MEPSLLEARRHAVDEVKLFAVVGSMAGYLVFSTGVAAMSTKSATHGVAAGGVPKSDFTFARARGLLRATPGAKAGVLGAILGGAALGYLGVLQNADLWQQD